MTVSTLRPTSTIDLTGTVSGAGSGHAALSDDSDSSYVLLDGSGELWQGNITDLSLPAGAIVKSVTIRCRTAQTAIGRVAAALQFTTDDYNVSSNIQVTWLTPTTVAFAARSLAIPDAEIDAVSLAINRIGSSGAIRVHEAYVDITYVEQPTVTVDAPTGTVEDTNIPQVSWTPSALDPDGSYATHHHVRIFTDAQYGIGGFDPATSPATVDDGPSPLYPLVGIVGQTITTTSGVPLDDGTYRAYARIAQTVNGELHWSDWDYAEFEIDVALPDVPVVTVTADPGNARVVIEIDDSGDADFPTTDYFEVLREPPGGFPGPIRQLAAGPIPDSGPAFTIYDYEMPIGVPVSYRLRSLHDYSGVLAVSEWVVRAVTLTLSPGEWWLKHPTRPVMNIPVTVRSFPTVSRAARRGEFQALGATNAVVVSDTRGAKRGQIVLRAETLEGQGELDGLLDLGTTLLLQSPAGGGGPGYVVFGNQDRTRVIDWEDASDVFETLEFTVVAKPDGNVEAWPS